MEIVSVFCLTSVLGRSVFILRSKGVREALKAMAIFCQEGEEDEVCPLDGKAFCLLVSKKVQKSS